MTLTEISFYSRKYMPFFIILCFFIIIFFYIIKLTFIYLSPTSQQQQVARINPIYGVIKKPIIQTGSPSADLEYVLDTIEGQPMTATETAKIFTLPPSVTRLKYIQQIYLMAQAIGFDTEMYKHTLVGTDAIFDDGKQKMTIDIASFNFVYELDMKELDKEEFFGNNQLPSEKEIEDKAINFINAVGRYPQELAQGKRNLVYITYLVDTNELKPAPENETTNMVEVDFYRSDIDDVSIISPKYFNSQNYVIIAFGKDSFRIIKAQIKFFEKSSEQYGIYPVKSGAVAWEQLKANKGVIVNKESNKTMINIKKMFLGYYDPDVYQEYLQPVYVFLGEDNFVGYVPAVDDKYLSN